MVPEITTKIRVMEIVVNDLGILGDAMFLGREPLLSRWDVIPILQHPIKILTHHLNPYNKIYIKALNFILRKKKKKFPCKRPTDLSPIKPNTVEGGAPVPVEFFTVRENSFVPFSPPK
jgi:hypothetical protein